MSEKIIIKLKEAGLPELRRIAEEVLNIDISGMSSAARIKRAITAASDLEEFEMSAPIKATLTAEPITGGVSKASHEYETRGDFVLMRDGGVQRQIPVDGDGRVHVNIPKTEDDSTDNIAVAVNGSNMLIPLGENVAIPPTYYEALVNAKRRIPVQDREGRVIGFNEVPRRAVSVIAPASGYQAA